MRKTTLLVIAALAAITLALTACGGSSGNATGSGPTELGEPLHLVVRVVEPRNQQRDDLEPDSHLVQRADRAEDGLDSSAQLAIVTIVEALEIDFVEIDPRAQVFEDTRRAVPVRHVPGQQPALARRLEHRDRPFARNQRLVVRAHHHAAAEPHGFVGQQLRGDIDRRRHGIRIAERLRRDPVLAIRAVEIAPEHSEAERKGARAGVEEWLLLDWIALHAADVAVGHVQRPAAIEAHLADAKRAVGNRALVTAGVAAQAAAFDPLDELGRGLDRSHFEHLGEGRHRSIVPCR